MNKYPTCPKEGLYMQKTQKIQTKWKRRKKRVYHDGGEEGGGGDEEGRKMREREDQGGAGQWPQDDSGGK